MPLGATATTATTTTAEELPGRLHPPIPSRPGMKYPVRAYPSLRFAGGKINVVHTFDFMCN